MNPKVSVVLSTFNHMRFLQACTDSILGQTFKNFEFIVIDDGSTDDTWPFLEKLFEKDKRIKLVRHLENYGIQKSYNEGLKMALGDYITWVSSDNFYLPTFLEHHVKALDDHPEAMFAYSAFHWVNEGGRIIKTNYEQYLGPHALLIENPGVASFLYRRELHEKLGYLEENIGLTADTDFWIRMVEEFKTVYVPKILCYFMWSPEADSFKRYSTTPDSIKKVVENASNRRRQRRIASKRSPHVLFITPNFVPEWYAGVEVYTYNLAKELILRGIEVSVAYPKYGPGGIIDGEYERIKTHILVHDTDPRGFRLSVENKVAEDLFIELLDQNKFDIIHFHHTAGFPFSLIRLAKKCGYPVCLSLHDFYFLCTNTFLRTTRGEQCKGPDTIDQCVDCLIGMDKGHTLDEIASSYYIMAYRQANNREILQMIDVLTCSSSYTFKIFTERGFGTGKMEIDPPGIVPIKKIPWDRKLSDSITLGYLGVIHPIKNLSILIKVFKSVPGNLKLVIWGTGREEHINSLKEEIKEDLRIEYRGFYRSDQLPRIYSEFDVTIIPSFIENYSLIARESFSAGVPVIGTSIGGIPDLIKKGVNGRLIDPYDCEGLKDSIDTLNWGLIDYWRRNISKIKTIEEDAREWIERYKNLL